MTAELDAAKVREAVAYVQRKAEAADAADPATWYPSCVLQDDHHHEPIEAAFISACTPTRLLLLCQAALDSLAQRERVGELEGELVGLKQEKDRYVPASFALAAEIDQLRSELEAARADLSAEAIAHQRTRTEGDDAIRGLQRELEAARAERERLYKKLSGALTRRDKRIKRDRRVYIEKGRLQALCAAAYQIVGTVAHEQYGDGDSYPGRFEKLMDALGKAGNGEGVEGDPIQDLLPFSATPSRDVAQGREDSGRLDWIESAEAEIGPFTDDDWHVAADDVAAVGNTLREAIDAARAALAREEGS